MVNPMNAAKPHASKLRIIRRAFYVLLVASALWFTWKYDISSIPDDYVHLIPQKMPPGSTIILTDYDESVVVGLGTVVLYLPPEMGSVVQGEGAQPEDQPGNSRLAFGVVAGIPGETIEVVSRGEGVIDIVVGDRREKLAVPLHHRLKPGVIPPDHYLVLHGDRHIVAGLVSYPDSRNHGLVNASRFRSKVVVSLNFF